LHYKKVPESYSLDKRRRFPRVQKR